MLLLAFTLQVQSPPPPPRPELHPNQPAEMDATVVVTGKSLPSTREALEKCLATKCPSKEDIAKSLAYAEVQFMSGDYKGSRKTLLAARHRNANQASSLPYDVARLHRALSRITRLNGIAINPRVNAADAVYALRAGLPAASPAIFAQRLEVGDELAREGRLNGALQHYDWVAREAGKAGLKASTGMAYLRSAILLTAVAAEQPPYRNRAMAAVTRIMKLEGSDMLPFRNAARALQIQIVPEQDRASIAARLAPEMELGDDGQQMLVYAPMIDTSRMPFGSAAGEEAPAYADISFRVMPDGRVTDVTPITVTQTVRPIWVEAITKALAERRYTPRRAKAGDGGMLHLERYSFVSPLIADSGSRMPRRSPTREINTTDLTAAIPNR
ncbi:hypothetical protein [Sphingomonas sp. PB1R3]|uniref:hypothetical protein n=1 Tax=Sphingomonas flavida TaxID=3096154 RepID=UPI002FC6BBA5